MARVAWTPVARRDLQHVEDFISADSVEHAHDFVAALKEAVGRLVEIPMLGREAPIALRVEGLRQLNFGQYRIVYRVRGERVEIHGIIHGAMDLERIAKSRGWLRPKG